MVSSFNHCSGSVSDRYGSGSFHFLLQVKRTEIMLAILNFNTKFFLIKDPDPEVGDTDSRILIRSNMARILNTGFDCTCCDFAGEPEFLESPSSLTVFLGQTAFFRCRVSPPSQVPVSNKIFILLMDELPSGSVPDP
jgi:hypothetical protein